MSEKICVNGRMVDADKAKLSVLDYGLLYGYGLFETMRAYSGRVFMLEEHMKRLCGSANEIGIRVNAREMKRAIRKTLNANKRKDAYVRLTVTYGIGRPRINLAGGNKPNYFVITDDVPDYAKQYRNGVKLSVSKRIKQSRHSHTPRLKTLNYLDRVMAKKEAMEKGFSDAIIMDDGDYVAEATTANIFAVKGDTLTTPGLNQGILPGITRRIIIDIAKKEGLKVEEGKIKLKELLESNEIFTTNSMAEVMPVVEIDGRRIGKGTPGKTTRRMHERYKKLTTL
jgi:branched-chain amino acid aminotransferase